MKLKEVCRIGKEVGMTTIGESVDNIDHHAMSLFKYDDISNQLTEMYTDPLWDELDLKREDTITKVIGKPK
tara:strand:+ start:139 stop:351 length:213 start_codon:yes stop_codon:yes gene_type:complete